MDIFPKPPFMKQILHLKAPVTLLLFTGSLFCEIPKAPSLFKEWIATERHTSNNVEPMVVLELQARNLQL